ncbi:DUF2924 domain-containing protein [uncultured Nitratireductor sp.]|uniref:DUF2924 domain-containing protein n=1 Tax=uncultured Nitratireductor sp. TaxID=520953 RepID=UPI0025DA0A20|nr:DUF2924 domain-containing protein [uncultured Nitratireductor sp.]
MAMRATFDIAAEAEALNELTRDELVDRWRKIYGSLPPKGVRQDLLKRAILWHTQSKHFGGIPVETRRLLRAAVRRVEQSLLSRHQRRSTAAADEERSAEIGAAGVAGDCSPQDARPQRQRRTLAPGARLIREWNGQTHTVDVIEGGYVFEARVYRSLTAIAGKITGTHWSGPRFFGL